MPPCPKQHPCSQGRLASEPDDEDAAAALAELLPEDDTGTDWTILQPEVMTSAAGAILSRQPDGSVFVSNPGRFVDTQTFEAVADLSGITA